MRTEQTRDEDKAIILSRCYQLLPAKHSLYPFLTQGLLSITPKDTLIGPSTVHWWIDEYSHLSREHSEKKGMR